MPEQNTSQTYRFQVIHRLGELILKNGGEIFRADMAMRSAAKAYELKDYHSYTIANGVFASYCNQSEELCCQVLTIPMGSVNLAKVEMLNDLSRRISSGKCSPLEAEKEMDRIEQMKNISLKSQLLGACLGSGFFSLLVDGSYLDAISAAAIGIILEMYLIFVLPKLHFPKIMANISASMLFTTVCCFFYYWGFGEHLDLMMIGPVFLLTPGIAITNSVRNFMENDYLTGLVRMVDALLIAGSIAVGVGVVMKIMVPLTGGII